MPQPNTLSDRERQVLHFIEIFRREKGYSASIRDISENFGYCSTSLASYYVKRLAKMGLLKYTPRVARSIVIVNPA